MFIKLEVHREPKIKKITQIACSDSFTNVLNNSPKMIRGNRNNTTDFIVNATAKIICFAASGMILFSSSELTMDKANNTGNFFAISRLYFQHFKNIGESNTIMRKLQ